MPEQPPWGEVTDSDRTRHRLWRVSDGSGRTLTFSFYANDVPDGASPTPTMDAALLLIAEQN